MKASCAAVLWIVSGILCPLLAAVAVIDPYPEPDAEALLAGHNAGWSAEVRAGGDSGFDSHEVELHGNTLFTGQVNWTTSRTVVLIHDSSGNLSLTVGAETWTVQPLEEFTHILVEVGDSVTFFGGTVFENASYGITSLPDLLVDEAQRYFLIETGETSPEFVLSFDFQPPTLAGGRESHVSVYGLTVPEPSSIFMLSAAIAIACSRRKRPAPVNRHEIRSLSFKVMGAGGGGGTRRFQRPEGA